MATFTTIPDTDLDADSPITENLMLALRDNPLAIASGDVTAPRVQKEALGENSVGNYLLSNTLTYTSSFTASNSTNVVGSYVYTTITTTGLIMVRVTGYGETATDHEVGIQFKVNGTWGTAAYYSGQPNNVCVMGLSDGTNIRIYAKVLSNSKTVTATSYIDRIAT